MARTARSNGRPAKARPGRGSGDGLTVSLRQFLVDGTDLQFREFVADLFAAAAGMQSLRRALAKSVGLSAAEFSVLLATRHLQRRGASGLGCRRPASSCCRCARDIGNREARRKGFHQEDARLSRYACGHAGSDAERRGDTRETRAFVAPYQRPAVFGQYGQCRRRRCQIPQARGGRVCEFGQNDAQFRRLASSRNCSSGAVKI